jgi:hypothetical protein
MSAEEELRWMWLAASTAMRIWDDESWAALSVRYVQLARHTGALSELPLALLSQTFTQLFAGELATAALLADEVQAVTEATGSSLAPYGALGVAALRGDEAPAAALIEATIREVPRRGEGVGITFAEWARAVLHNGLGQYHRAAAAARRVTAFDIDLAPVSWSLVELIEADARSGMTETATAAYVRLREMTSASGTDWALGAQARSLALLSEGDEAERLYRECRSPGWAGPACAWTWPAHGCCTGSGCAGSAAAPTPGSSCAWLSACWPSSAWPRSRSGPGASCRPRARLRAPAAAPPGPGN